MSSSAVPPPDDDCWLHPSVEVGPSPIDGRGLFAITPIATGTVVARLGGRLVDAAELRRLLAAAAASSSYVDSITVLAGVHLVLPPRRPVGYGNHSCDPALWHVDAYTLAARRDIAAGDEVTVDYATQTAEPDFVMTCRCGTALCRGAVTGSDWRRPDLQERYGGHWVPALQTRIAAELRAEHGGQAQGPRLASAPCPTTTPSEPSSASGRTRTTRPTSRPG